MKEKKYILFDFDGVIVDSLDLAFSINKQNKAADYTVDDYKKLLRGNIYSHFKVHNQTKNAPVSNFFVQYEPGILKLHCVPGMSEVIKKSANSYSLIIISSTNGAIIEKFLKKHNLFQYFLAILGPEVDRDKTKKIQIVFETFKTDATKCLFITDTLGDIKEAAEADVKSIGVAWGYHSKETMLEGSPHAFAGTPQELLDLITEFFAVEAS